MKKLLVLSLAVMVLLGTAGYLSASPVYSRGSDSKVNTEVVESTGAGSQVAATVITTVNRLIAWTIADSTSAGLVGMHDVASTGAITTSTGVAEASVAAGYTYHEVFPLPIDIDNGIAVEFASATAVAIIYYE